MKFDARRFNGFPLLTLVVLFFLPLTQETLTRDTIILIVSHGFFTWFQMGTYYVFTEDKKLKIVFGPFRKKINLDEIESIKPCLLLIVNAFLYGSFVITDKKGKSYYVNPLFEKRFIEEFQKRNSNIRIGI